MKTVQKFFILFSILAIGTTTTQCMEDNKANKGAIALYRAVMNNDIERAQQLLESGAKPIDLLDEMPILHCALYARNTYNNSEMIKLLLKHNASITVTEKTWDLTPLCTAINLINSPFGNPPVESIKLLLEAGSNLYVRNKFKRTVLGEAIYSHALPAVKEIIKYTTIHHDLENLDTLLNSPCNNTNQTAFQYMKELFSLDENNEIQACIQDARKAARLKNS